MIRKRILVDEWVVIAPERAARPRQIGLSKRSSADIFCPFCPENSHVTPPTIQQWGSPAFPDAPWGVRAIPNKFPALRVEERRLEPDGGPEGSDLYQSQVGVGAHEVIIESPDHRTDWQELPSGHLSRIFGAWQDRISDLRGDRRLRCAVAFKNQGAAAGATLEHVHSQLIALPLIPARLQRELGGARHFHEANGRCALCEMLQRELKSGERIVLQNEGAVAIAPYGSRMPFEIWILPRAHRADFTTAGADELQAAAELAGQILSLWKKALGPTGYNLVLHSLPFDFAGEWYYHWHLEMLPRTGQIAGFEWGSDIYINATASEVAARHLRELAN